MNHYYIAEEKTVGDFRVVVGADEDGSYCNPRDNDNFSTMLTWGYCTLRRSVGDEQLSEHPDFTIECPDCEGTGEAEDHWEVTRNNYTRDIIADGFASEAEADAWAEKLVGDDWFTSPVVCPRCKGEREIEVTPEEWLRETRDALVVLPLSVSDNSVSIDRDWDDADGAIYATADDLLKGWGKWNGKMGAESHYADPNESGGSVDWWNVIERIEPSNMRGQVDEYSDWANGEVYYFSVEDADGDMLESCGGFIGDEGVKYALSEGIDHAQWLIGQQEKESREAAYWRTRDVETVPA